LHAKGHVSCDLRIDLPPSQASSPRHPFLIMRTSLLFPRFILMGSLLSSGVFSFAADWPVWRGPQGDGRSAESGFPTHWSATENIRWKTPCLPGHASPIVVGEQIFTAGYEAETGARVLLAFSRSDGSPRWRKTVVESGAERIHSENSRASSTPASDGRQVYCAFLDGREPVVAAYTLRGDVVWTVRPGVFSSVHGFCSTPILHKDKVIVNCDHDGPGYIVALSAADGKELWRIERPNRTRSYVAPLLREAGGRVQLVLSGSKCIAGYDPDTGKLLWMIDGPTDQFVASMVFSDRTQWFYMTGGFPKHHVMAIRPDGTGNITSSHIAWHYNPPSPVGVSYVPSPIVEGDWLLLNDDRGFAHAFDARSGEIVWSERFGRQHASLVSTGGLVYFLNDAGECRVVRPAEKFAVVSVNSLGEGTYASPALSEGQIFLRSNGHLWCVGERRRGEGAGIVKVR
jgi:outer membrane protein assembly factor BamB